MTVRVLEGGSPILDRIRALVRDTLGCTCPDAVLERVLLGAWESPAGVGLRLRRVAVGGRLLIYLLAVADPDALPGRLPPILEAGREERDRGGFNRLRVVVASADPQTLEGLCRAPFDRIRAGDERMHLHLLPLAALPTL
jgi:hypothetical protein